MTRGKTIALVSMVLLVGAMGVMAVPGLRSVVTARLPPVWRISLSAWRHGVLVNHGVITMPDGVRLTASLYRPSAADGPMPTVLVRVPYHRLRYSEGYDSGLFFARQGYAVVVQDLRGTGDSGGELLPWRDAAKDGVATLDWIARRLWSTGKVGTYGCSGLGETQLVLAKKNHPAHAAMIPSGAGGAVGSVAGRYGYFGLYEGGVFQLASGFGWFVEHGNKQTGAPAAAAFEYAEVLGRLPVSSPVKRVRPAPNGYTDFIGAAPSDPRWNTWGYLSEADPSRVPSLVINTWGDQTVGDALALAEAWRMVPGALSQKVVIGPGNHCHRDEAGSAIARFGDLPVRNAAWPREQWSLRWFEHWLRGRADTFDDIKAYNYFMLVEDQWNTADQWPPAEARIERWFLGSSGHANTRAGDRTLARTNGAPASSDSFRYDPASPVPSRGGPLCCTGNPDDRVGPTEQADVEAAAMCSSTHRLRWRPT